MSVIDLVTLVHRMREAQKRYFAQRTPDNLRRSKVLEHEVDKALAALAKPDADEKKRPATEASGARTYHGDK